MLAWAYGAQAEQIAGGGAPEISFIRIGAAFIICIAAAIGLIAFVRKRTSTSIWPGLHGLLRRADQHRRISIVEVSTLPSRMEIALIRHDEAEYLLAYGPFGIEILSRGRRSADVNAEA